MRIFLTGGTGFIGRHFYERLLRAGHEAYLLSRRLEDEAAWREEVEKFSPEVVAHLAWEGIPDASEELAKKNLKMSLGLLETAGEMGCKTFLGIGSSLEYGGLEGKVSEDMTGTPPNPLYAAKATFYKKGSEKAKSFGIKFIWARPFYVYGPGQREGSLIPHLISMFKKGEKPEIKNPDGANDFVYVEDVANALALLLEKDVGEGAYNIGSGHLTSVREIVAAVAKTLHVPAPELPQPSISAPAFYADVEKIKKEVGWKAKTLVGEGIRQICERYS